MPAPVAILHHLPRPFTGYLGEALSARGIDRDDRHVSAGDPLPDLEAVSAVVALGGYESVTELERHPHLVEEAKLLRTAVQRGVPVLGVCLGAQLLAHALGGSVRRIGPGEPRWPLATRAAPDPLFDALPECFEVLHWNEDGFTAPPGAVEPLSSPEPTAAAFRHGERAWGVQFHPEIDPPAMATLLEHARRAGDPQDAERQRESSLALFGAFVELAAGRG